MTALEYILEGFEAELALERELGVRSVEIDRSLLAPPSSGEALVRAAAAPLAEGRPAEQRPASDERVASLRRTEQLPAVSRPVPESRPAPSGGLLDFVFLHDRPLSPGGVEMMAKIASAMGKTPETAPVVHDKPIPRARVYVVLGGLAMRKWFPGRNASPVVTSMISGSWNFIKTIAMWKLVMTAYFPSCDQVMPSLPTHLESRPVSNIMLRLP